MRHFIIAMLAGACALSVFGLSAQAQPQYPKPTVLPNPYRLVKGWPTLPTTMNGGHWGEVIRVSIDHDGNIWVFHRCFAVVPPGSAVCLGLHENDPPILKFDPSESFSPALGPASSRTHTASPSIMMEICGRAM